jgi:hypothetical protein
MNTQVLSWARPAARDRAVVNYYSGRMDTTLPFDEFRRRSLINEAARAADDAPDFSQRIRASQPTISRQ